jgi:hypothetical protein
MSRGRSDGSQKKRLVASVCAVALFLGFLYVFQGSIFGSQNSGSSTTAYGKSLKRLGASYLGADDDADSKQQEESSSLAQTDAVESDIVPKSFPVRFCSKFKFIYWLSKPALKRYILSSFTKYH